MIERSICNLSISFGRRNLVIRFILGFFIFLSPLFGLREAKAKECWGGFSCEQTGQGAFAFKLARDCSSVFEIDPRSRPELDKIMVALRTRPTRDIWPDEFSSKRYPRADKECEGAGRKVLFEGVTIPYIQVKPIAKKKLQGAL